MILFVGEMKAILMIDDIYGIWYESRKHSLHALASLTDSCLGPQEHFNVHKWGEGRICKREATIDIHSPVRTIESHGTNMCLFEELPTFTRNPGTRSRGFACSALPRLYKEWHQQTLPLLPPRWSLRWSSLTYTRTDSEYYVGELQRRRVPWIDSVTVWW